MIYIRENLAENRYKCDLCDYSTAKTVWKHLKGHINCVHSGEKSLTSVNLCDFSTAQRLDI